MIEHHERYLTAHHEAGHAVALLMRGGELTSITIEPTPDHVGYTGMRLKQWDAQFVTYAGPWAEARAQWPQDGLNSLNDEDAEGYLFADYVLGALLINQDGDAADYGRLESQSDTALIAAREDVWSRELEYHWPVICTVARLLLDDCTEVAAITAAAELQFAAALP